MEGAKESDGKRCRGWGGDGLRNPRGVMRLTSSMREVF